MPTNIHIKVDKRSKSLTLLLSSLHILVIAWLFYTNIPWWLAMLGCCWVLAIFMYGWFKKWQPTSSIKAISYQNQQWTIFASGKWQKIDSVKPSFICPWLVIFYCYKDKKRYGCLLANDTLSIEECSLLRILINLKP